MSKPFKFKQFTVHQDKCAMKVGTDGVLLGAWASIKNNPASILDIGTGTGLIAMQMAQRSNASVIDAIEIEAAAFEQAVENFERSPWGDRLFCYHASLATFATELDEKYDLIISNPPFYSTGHVTENKARNKARFTKSLTFNDLLKATTQLLTATGVFSLIIPFHEEASFLELAKNKGFIPKRICRVKGNTQSPVKRSLLELELIKTTLNKSKKEPIITDLTIEIKRHQYTDEYLLLVDEFYLNLKK